MGFTIPNEGSASYPQQAEPDKVDLDILAAGASRTGVVTGCTVTAHGGTMSVDVAAGMITVAGTRVTVNAVSALAIGAATGNPRFDLVVVDNTGTVSVTAGTAAAAAVFPSVPANSAVLASVYVPTGTTSIDSGRIVDKRVLISLLDNSIDPTGPTYGLSTSGTAASNQTALNNAMSDGSSLKLPVIVPAGTYSCLALTVPANVRLVGKPGAVLQHAITNGSSSTQLLRATGANVEISDLTLDGGTSGSQTDSHSKHGVVINAVDQVKIRRTTFQNFSGDGVQILGGATNVAIESCYFTYCNGFGVVGRYRDPSNTLSNSIIRRLRVDRCHFERTYGGHSAIGAEVSVTNPNGTLAALGSCTLPGSGGFSITVSDSTVLPVTVSGISPGIIYYPNATTPTCSFYYTNISGATVTAVVLTGGGTVIPNAGNLDYTDSSAGVTDSLITNNTGYCIDHDMVAFYSAKNARIQVLGNVVDNYDQDVSAYYVPTDAGYGGGLVHLGGSDHVIANNQIRGADGRAIVLSNYPNDFTPRGSRAAVTGNVIYHTALGPGTIYRSPRDSVSTTMALAYTSGGGTMTVASTNLFTATATDHKYLTDGLSVWAYTGKTSTTFTGVTTVSGTGSIANNATLRSAVAYLSNGEGILTQNYTDVTISGNKVYQAAESGIHVSLHNSGLSQTSKFATISGNQLQSCAGPGIWVGDSSFCTVTGNVLDDNGGSTYPGIRMTGASYCTVVSNTVISSGTDGVLVENGSDSNVTINCIITQNVIGTSGAYGVHSTGSSDYLTTGNTYYTNTTADELLVGTHNTTLSGSASGALSGTAVDSTFTFVDNVTSTKKGQFDLVGISALTTRTLTWPNASGTILLSSACPIGSAGFTLAGSGSGTATVVAASAAGGTWTVPNATDTFVGKATSDIFTNKTLTSPQISGGSSGTVTLVGSSAASGTLTLPNGADTLVGRATADTLTGVKTFGDGKLVLAGSSSGSSTLKAPSTGGGTITLPAGTDTLAGLGTVQSFTASQSFSTTATSSVTISHASAGGTLFSNPIGATGIDWQRGNASNVPVNTNVVMNQRVQVVDSGSTAHNAGQIQYLLDENVDTTHWGGHFSFLTAATGGGSPTSAERTRVSATGLEQISGSILAEDPAGKLGYGTGAGGTVTQATSKSTGVTLSKPCGQITMNGAALAAATIVSFVVTDTVVASTDTILINHVSGGTLGSYGINAAAASGSFTVYVRNNTAGSLSEALVLSFTVIKGVTS